MKKCNKRIASGQQWPIEVEASVKYPKATDTSDKQIGKRQKEKEVLEWFVYEGNTY